MLPSGNGRGGAQTKCFDENILVEGEIPGLFQDCTTNMNILSIPLIYFIDVRVEK